MINSKKDYLEYIAADEYALNMQNKGLIVKLMNPIWCYERALRKREYYQNCKKGILWKLPGFCVAFRHRRIGFKYGFSIPVNVFGKGLNIAHVGTIIVNSNARVGDYCRIHACTNIGTQAGIPDAAPVIGDRVYIGPGAKIFGKITIANDIAIGANAVVNKSFSIPNITIAGVPAKQISNKGSKGLLYSPVLD